MTISTAPFSCGDEMRHFLLTLLIIELARAPPPDDASSLLEWITKQGGDIRGVEVKSNAAGIRGVYATQNIPKGSYFVVMPRSLLLSSTTPNTYDLVTPEGWEPRGFHANAGLIRSLLSELRKGKRSFWRPYFESIHGQSLSTMELSESEVGSMKGSLSYTPFHATWKRFLAMRDTLCRDEACGWAVGMVGSRHFEFEVINPSH